MVGEGDMMLVVWRGGEFEGLARWLINIDSQLIGLRVEREDVARACWWWRTPVAATYGRSWTGGFENFECMNVVAVTVCFYSLYFREKK